MNTCLRASYLGIEFQCKIITVRAGNKTKISFHFVKAHGQTVDYGLFVRKTKNTAALDSTLSVPLLSCPLSGILRNSLLIFNAPPTEAAA